jgi:hypothetical protein
MDPKFAALVETLAPKLAQLLAIPPLAYGALPRDMPHSGVYLFTEAGRHLYVGRSNVLRALWPPLSARRDPPPGSVCVSAGAGSHWAQ